MPGPSLHPAQSHCSRPRLPPEAGAPWAMSSFSHSDTLTSGWLSSGTLAVTFDSLPPWVFPATEPGEGPLRSSNCEDTEQGASGYQAQWRNLPVFFDWQKILMLDLF